MKSAFELVFGRLMREHDGAEMFNVIRFRELMVHIGTAVELFLVSGLSQLTTTAGHEVLIISEGDNASIVKVSSKDITYLFNVYENYIEISTDGKICYRYSRQTGVPIESSLSYGDTYRYLDRVMAGLIVLLGMRWEDNAGIVAAHADKCDQYRSTWEKAGIPYHHGAALYLLSYTSRYADSVRQTPRGFIPPAQWVIDIHREIGHLLPVAASSDFEQKKAV